MPSPVTAYRIFIASPGGLDQERLRFREIINEYNESDALERGVLFIPVGWELSGRGMGRPQAIINQDLSRCDYCLLILHERWGSPTSAAGAYSSGTEEEYALSRKLIAERKMLDLVIWFKAVEPSRLNDPGPQLQKVLDFKLEIEREKALFFDTYEDIAQFEKQIRRRLSGWTRAHEDRAKSGNGK